MEACLRFTLARDHLLETEVALKMIHPHLMRESMVVDRFKREVAISRSIRHPGIIRIYDFYEIRAGSSGFIVIAAFLLAVPFLMGQD